MRRLETSSVKVRKRRRGEEKLERKMEGKAGEK